MVTVLDDSRTERDVRLDGSVLIVYAARSDPGRGIAERLASALRERGHDVALHEIDQVADVDDYEGAIVGSELHEQQWLPEADAFVRRHANLLAARPVWLFSVGSPERKGLGLPRRDDHRLRELEQVVRSREARTFREGLEAETPQIDSWAAQISEALREGTSKAPPGF